MSKLAKVQKALEKAQNRAATVAKKFREGAEETVERAVTVAGGAAGGVIDAKFEGKTLMGINPNMAIGGIATIVGIAGWAGKTSDMVGSFGVGVLAYEAGKAAKEAAKQLTK